MVGFTYSIDRDKIGFYATHKGLKPLR